MTRETGGIALSTAGYSGALLPLEWVADRPRFKGKQIWEMKGLVKPFDGMAFSMELEMTSSDFLSITPWVTIFKAKQIVLIDIKRRKERTFLGVGLGP